MLMRFPDRPLPGRLPLFMALRDLADRAHALDPRVVPVEDVATAVLADATSALLRRALETMQALQEAGAGDGPDVVGDVCFAGAFELNRARRELAAARDPDERLVAAETGRRKLRRALRAVLEAARESGEQDVLGGAHQGMHHVADLESGLTVRRLYASFRRALRRPASEAPDDVLVAVRYAAGALAALVTAPDYADVRASDRAILRRLRERAFAWARTDRAVREGLNLLEDVWTSADLLRDINRRQELRAHDAALVMDLLAGPASDPAAWFARLDTLAGLDDALDVLVERARAAPHPEDLVPELLARLSHL
jgi:hypothetical protein